MFAIGHAKSTPDHNGLLWLSSISESEKSEIVNLIKKGQDSVLKRTWGGFYSGSDHYSKYWSQYQHAEVLIAPYLSFHL